MENIILRYMCLKNTGGNLQNKLKVKFDHDINV